MGAGGGRKPHRRYYRGQTEVPEIVKARAEQREQFDSVLQEVNKFVYSNMTSTRKERALKKQWEDARAEALGCTPEKGVNHSFKHLKAMREAKANKRELAAVKAQMGEDVDTRSNLNRDITEVRRMRKDKRKEIRDKNRNPEMSGASVGSKGSVNHLIRKFAGGKADKTSNTEGNKTRKRFY